MKRLLSRALLTLVLVLVGLYALASWLGPRLVYYGVYFDDTRECQEPKRYKGGSELSFTTSDGTALHGWYWNRGPGAPLVIVYGGNNMNVGSLAMLTKLAPKTSFLMLNHRGYGQSEGRPSEAALVGDAREVVQRIRQKQGEQLPITLLGFSLGTGVATQVAATEKVQQLILACPFDSVLATGCQHVPLLPRFLPLDHFRSDLAAPEVDCPVTIFMGANDDIVPPARTLHLAQCFSSAKVQLHTIASGHNDVFDNDDVLRRLKELLDVTPKP